MPPIDESLEETDVPAEGSADVPSEGSLDEPYPTPLRQFLDVLGSPGRRLRLAVLVVNVVICVGCLAFQSMSRSGRLMTLWADPTWMIVMQVVPTVLLLGPLVLMTTLAAWGPWRPVVRILIPIVASVVVAGAQQAFDVAFLSWYVFSELWDLWRFLNQMSNWLCVLGAAALGLAMIGSVIRVRIGPPELGPIRVTIFSILLSTALIGVLISGKTMIDTAFWSAQLADMSTSPELGRPDEIARSQVVSQIVIGAPLVCVFACCCAAAAFYWYARIAILASTLCVTTIIYVTTSTSGPPAGMQPSMSLVVGSIGMTLVLAGIWIAISVRLLHRSGWHCSRRAPLGNTMTAVE